jgi:hypothetical protein
MFCSDINDEDSLDKKQRGYLKAEISSSQMGLQTTVL